MSTKVFLLSMTDEIGIHLALVLCGLSIIFLALHVRRRFVRASGALTTLKKEWEDAQAHFFNLAEVAERQIGGLETAHVQSTSQPPGSEISSGLRTQVTAMSRNGAAVVDIARAAELSEAEINVLLGMSRVKRGKNSQDPPFLPISIR